MKTESIRQRKIADEIKKKVSQIIDRKLKDPRKGFITITNVKISGDMRIASIYYSSLGDEEQRKDSKKALESAQNFIRSELAPYLKMRFVPELRFFYDDTLDYSQHIEDLIRQIHSDEDKNKNER
ncbi:MAG: 30S ribosome-binding factor RbfA [Calditrichaeota bacterium]|nr:30S ribosome-binding factor RbfA [Calditrichota bacterium]RQV92588.1 MAG: 30S ribosome-binding factor RbfA [bacterium]RQW07586.1 MAG: 30S ribosome-binding factor RbfA [Calditrichota bacterium]